MSHPPAGPGPEPGPIPATNVRKDAAEALSRIGAPARDAVPALTEALGDSDERVRKEAEEALGRITKTEPSGDRK